jgi:hypothetical protein
VAGAQQKNAKALLRRGNQLFTSGDYPAAYEVFKRGYDKRPSPVFLRNMAYSLLKMYQHEQARERLREYLKRYPHAPDRRKLANIVKGLDVVVTTRLEVTSKPPGASVYLDAEAGGRVGTTPYKGTIPPGKHTVILKARGFRTTTRELVIRAKQKLSIHVPLEVPLKITTKPAGARIFVDDKARGRAPYEGGITLGEHGLLVKLDPYLPHRARFRARRRRAVKIAVAMLVGVDVESKPPGAIVEVDGRPQKGRTPMVAGGRPGRRKVAVKLAGFRTETRSVVLVPGRREKISVRLLGGLLAMRADVPGAEVTVGDLKLGQTPLSRAAVPVGKQLVTVEHPGRRTWSRALDFDEGQLVRADLELGRPLWPVWLSAGLGVGAIITGSITGVLARNKVREAEDRGLCDGAGNPVPGVGRPGDCSFSLHHVSTASFIAAGVAAAVSLTYYLIWGRSKVKITRVSLGTAAR